MTSKRSYRVRQFFGGYFHQDFDLLASTWEGVVRAYIAEAPPETVRQLAEDLEGLLMQSVGPRVIPPDLDGDYDPSADGLTQREWVEGIVQMLRAG